ncbi:hypothetical protein MSAN_01328400 [Mycena sanguinolenta]|uniref:Uncharacterized protein n=1 Tax=Mycena sanguinolenta TaxID=230812 RepID=A0A8H7D2U1_9AGAR|nr:hypothetical protein MSAN_01328400 [Mycena sanguinolenta]
MSPSMAPAPTFCNVPVSAGCSVSLHWAINSGIRAQNSLVSGLLALPSNNGIVSGYVNNVLVASSLPFDLVLGLDWFAFVCDHVPGTMVHLSSGPLELRRFSPTLGVGMESSLSAAAEPSSAALMFRGDISANPLSSSSVSRGGPEAVLTPSSSSRTRGAGAVAASTLAALHTPRTRGANDNIVNNVLPINDSFNDEPVVSYSNDDRSVLLLSR